MSASRVLENISKSPALGYALIGVVAIVGVIVVKNALEALGRDVGDIGSKAVNAVGAAGSAVIDTASNIATGNVASAVGTPYEGAGILGTLGAETDALFGGGLSAFGGWIGDKAYSLTHPETVGYTAQGANNNPYNGGPSGTYAGAVDASPTNAQYAATPFAQAPLAVPF